MAVDATTNLYTDIKTILENLTTVSFVSLWNQDVDSNHQAIKRDSAVFFELESIEWRPSNDPASNRKQQESGVCKFALRVRRKSLKKDHDAGLELMLVKNDIHRNVFALASASTDNYGFIKRVGELQDVSHNNVMGWVLQYECVLYELPTSLGQDTVNSPDLEITKQLTNFS